MIGGALWCPTAHFVMPNNAFSHRLGDCTSYALPTTLQALWPRPLRMPLQENGRRILHASCQRCTLDERDAVIDALRPLVEQGWQIVLLCP
jgi:hypothetical protein